MKKLIALARVPEGRPLTVKVLPDRIEIYEEPTAKEQMQEAIARAQAVEQMAVEIATKHNLAPEHIDRSKISQLSAAGGKVKISDVLTEEGKAVWAESIRDTTPQ